MGGEEQQKPIETARFQMEGPGDLLRKLNYDLQRIATAKKRSHAAFAVFDFATTAWSIADWSWEAVKVRRSDLTKTLFLDSLFLKAIPEMEVCRLIATGAKHFIVSKDPKEIHTMVISTFSRTRDPLDGGKTVKTEKAAIAFVQWRGESLPCDEVFATVYNKVGLFLHEHGLASGSQYLTEIFDDHQ